METSLSAKDICNIIKASKNSGLKNIEIPGLTLEFFPRRNGDIDQRRNAVSGIAEAANAEVNQLPAGWREQAELFDEKAVSDAEDAALMVDDPMQFEQQVVLRDIERNRVMNG